MGSGRLVSPLYLMSNMSDMWPGTARPRSFGSLGLEGLHQAVFVEGSPPSIVLLQPIGSASASRLRTLSQDVLRVSVQSRPNPFIR